MNNKEVQKAFGYFANILFCAVLALSYTLSYADEPTEPTSQQAKAAEQDTSPKQAKTAEEDTSSQQEELAEQDSPPQRDPYEGFNRVMFTFNDKLDIYFLKPIATLYNKIMPKPLNQGIHNVFLNIYTLTTIPNDLLQANFYQATNDIWRLGINTTLGIGGLFDVAERMQLEPYSNDFGLTLAKWGYTNSNYLVLPFFGPNTVRDGIALPVDYFAFSLYPYIRPATTSYEIGTLGVIDRRAQLLKFQDIMEEAALDKYVFIRSAYMQRRAYQIKENQHRSCCDRKEVVAPVPVPVMPDENYDVL